MIRAIYIKNFQSHENTTINFEPGVNVFIGRSDSGKSSIIRALMWVLFNRPLGDEFKSWWGDEVSVTVEFDDHVITRKKGKNVNAYVLDGVTFEAFGQDVPEEILKAHRISRELNIQSQIDPFFLLQSSAGEVARYLNKIAGIDEIDEIVNRITKSIRSFQQQITNKDEEIAALQNDLSRFDGLEKLGEEIETLSHQQKIIEEQNRTFQVLSSLITQIQKSKRTINSLSKICELSTDVVQLEKMIAHVRNLSNAKTKLETTINRIKERTAVQEFYKQLCLLLPQTEETEKLIREYEQLTSRYKILSQTVCALKESKERWMKWNEKLHQRKHEFRKMFPTVCPLCGQPITLEHRRTHWY